MTTFITTGCYSLDAIKGMIDHPEDRSEAVGALLKKAGLNLVGYYMTTGENDFLIISEGDASMEDYGAAIVTAAAAGSASKIQTVIGMTGAAQKAVFSKAKGMTSSYKAPGKA